MPRTHYADPFAKTMIMTSPYKKKSKKKKAMSKTRKMKTYKRNPADEQAVRELVLYATNDYGLYEQRVLPIIANLQKKIGKKTYNKTKALKLWEYFANDAAKKYAKEFARPSEWNKIFSPATRKAAAKEFAEYYEDHLELKSNPYIPGPTVYPTKRPFGTRFKKDGYAMGVQRARGGKKIARAHDKFLPLPVQIPKGKRSGDTFKKGGKTYQVVSYVRAGKRIRYARKV